MDQTSGKINFKPIHDGVGFHPFSDGLPYSPQRQPVNTRTAPAPRPAGASLAGTPKYQAPKEVTRVKPSPNPVASHVATPSSSLIRRRFFAYLLDTTLHLGFWIFANLISAWGFGVSLSFDFIAAHLLGFLGFFLFSQWFFIALQEMLFETTLGKAFFSLEFKRDRRKIFPVILGIRSLVFMASSILLGLGLVYRPHDHLAELQIKS